MSVKFHIPNSRFRPAFSVSSALALVSCSKSGTRHSDLSSPNSEFGIWNSKLRAASRRGFSLVEIMLALAVISIGLTGVLALFPTALETARRSQIETRVAFIAQAIDADLRAFARHDPLTNSTFTRVFVRGDPGNPFPAAQHENTGSYTRLSLDSGMEQSLYILFDESGAPLAEASPGAYRTGERGNTAALYIARVSAQFNTADYPNLTLITLSVEHSADAPADHRLKYEFATLLAPQ